MAAGAWAALRSVVKPCIAASLIGLTVSDRYFSVAAVRGASMHPTFEGRTGKPHLSPLRPRATDTTRRILVRFLTVAGVSARTPVDHQRKAIKRVIGLPGDWISVPETKEIRKIPEGHCWVEGDNGSVSRDSRTYGPVPLGLVQGRVTHVVWPPPDLMKEAGSEWGLQLVCGARKRRTRSETLSIDAAALLLGEGERRRQEPGPEAQKDEAIHAAA
uniref:Mitochondrial inner membrane protease subunit 2 n=1 Tax=Aegilops tauschii TaxID=37682 RepID=R7W5W1_AEGTA